MPHLTSPHLAQLISKLKEIFQINQPELDFGIYRILNSRAAEIATFLETTLPQKIQTALASNAEQETAVYNHLFTFFSRYYDNGDFISQRRYKNDTYAYLELFSLMPTEKEKERTLLKKYLQDYTAKNTADYFIHKNLGKFLNQELDFYIKNEVMNLDNIQAETAFSEIEQNLQQIKILKTVAQEIIAFLAQLEDFQKKLWLKKKFVAGTHYLITLDHLSDELIETALANPAQLEQWQALFNVNASGLNAEKLCENYPHLVVDTSLFEPSFQADILKNIEDLDEQTNGLLIHSDNFQALNLLQARYKEQVKCIYIDPPYNTEKDRIDGKFVYKDGYPHSTWASFLYNLSYVRHIKL